MSNMGQGEWTEFYQRTSKRPPWETLLTALRNFEAEGMGNPKFAVDLGSGAGRDTFELIRQGWQVLAVDAQAESGTWIRSQITDEQQALLQTLAKPFEEMALPMATLINASYALPFCGADHFSTVWQHISNNLPIGGRFSGHFFGNHDEWVTKPIEGLSTLHFTRSEAEALFEGFEIEMFEERDEMGVVASGDDKHWHTYSVVAIKKEDR